MFSELAVGGSVFGNYNYIFKCNPHVQMYNTHLEMCTQQDRNKYRIYV